MSAAPSVVSAASRSSLRVSCKNLMVKIKGRSVSVAATSGYSPRSAGASLVGPSSRVVTPTADDSRFLINAEHIHGDEQKFWTDVRYSKGSSLTKPLPYWDRMAQTAIMMTRRAARVPQEAAFRLMAVYLKMLMVVKLVDLSSMMLPVWMSHNVQGLLGAELEKKNGDGEPKKEGDGEKKAADGADAAAPAGDAAAAPATPEAPKA